MDDTSQYFKGVISNGCKKQTFYILWNHFIIRGWQTCHLKAKLPWSGFIKKRLWLVANCIRWKWQVSSFLKSSILEIQMYSLTWHVSTCHGSIQPHSWQFVLMHTFACRGCNIEQSQDELIPQLQSVAQNVNIWNCTHLNKTLGF